MKGHSRGATSAADARVRRHAHLPAIRALPWIVTTLIFIAIFKRVPFASVWHALEGARLGPYLAIMAPYSVAYLAVDTFCLTQVINWFNGPIGYRDVLPIRATTYLLTLVNSNLGQGGIALYLHFRIAGERLSRHRAARILRSFRLARPRHYVLLLLYKSPNFIMATVVYYFALRCFGITLPYRELLLFLPIIFFSAALPIGVAHLGAPQLLWIYFFGHYAPEAGLLAFSLATHFIFMIMNAALGVPFLPRATRELIRGAERATA